MSKNLTIYPIVH